DLDLADPLRIGAAGAGAQAVLGLAGAHAVGAAGGALRRVDQEAPARLGVGALVGAGGRGGVRHFHQVDARRDQGAAGARRGDAEEGAAAGQRVARAAGPVVALGVHRAIAIVLAAGLLAWHSKQSTL